MFYEIKTFPLQDIRDNDNKSVAASEVAILRKLESCPFVVTLIEYYEGINESCIITEYLAGSDLFNTIAHKSYELSENKCKVISAQILEAISFMHSKRIIHMDIKPNNIMFVNCVKDNLRVKIIDFGLARELGGLGRAKMGGMVGTVRKNYFQSNLTNVEKIARSSLCLPRW